MHENNNRKKIFQLNRALINNLLKFLFQSNLLYIIISSWMNLASWLLQYFPFQPLISRKRLNHTIGGDRPKVYKSDTRWPRVWLRFERGTNVLSGSQSTHKRINSVLMGGRKSRESTSSRGASRRIYDAWQICSGGWKERERGRLGNNVLDPLLLSPPFPPFLSTQVL